MARGLNGYQIDDGYTLVTIQADGSGSRQVSFTQPFLAAPQVQVQENAGDVAAGAVYEATLITKDSFTVSVTGSSLVSQDIRVLYFARERA